jgi:hypothetical protein
MKKNRIVFLLLISLGVSAGTVLGQSAMKGLHGTLLEDRMGFHAGNKIHITFFNDGTYGGVSGANTALIVEGTWPDDFYGLRHDYLMDGNVFIVSEVLDAKGQLIHLHSTVRSAGSPGATTWSSGDASPAGEWWTFLPLPGFANTDPELQRHIAMSKWREAWPTAEMGGWPDKSDDPIDPGWKGKWNGYFGKDIFNADEESYFVADDWNNREFEFYPDSTDLARRGLGIRMYVRGFQWSNALVEDALFVLYDIENVGTHHHDKVVFGYKIGNNMGDTNTGLSDEGNDMGAYELENDVAYLYDFDNIGGGGSAEWPNGVGYIGGAFLESPGNPYDGIDNDNDGISNGGAVITEALWAPTVLHSGDKIVLIDYKTFARTVKTYGVDTEPTINIHYQDLTLSYTEGDTLKEIQANLIDDNLNGVVDESNGYSYGTAPNIVTNNLYVGCKYINYITGEGLGNPMIEERRDDGVDNDGDWDVRFDDLGQDGVANTHDPGEKDGQATNGEPHFDKVDISETDMIGLTSFNLYDWPTYHQADDEATWLKLKPGRLDDQMNKANVEIMWGSGYFPMPVGQVQRFSMGVLYAFTVDEMHDNHHYATLAYNENYNFSKAPAIPTLTAIPGDNRVTLMWDDIAEQSKDPIAGYDFEGYKIYRSTDPGWGDLQEITDGKGNLTYRKPIAQFDVKNGVTGYAPIATPGMGIHFWLGEDNGVKHMFVDTTAKNGYNYFYAVTSYDRGDQLTEAQITKWQQENPGKAIPAQTIAPTECSKSIIVLSGQPDPVLGTNVRKVKPEAPAAGFAAAGLDSLKMIFGSTASGSISYEIVNPLDIQDGHKYRVTFEDSLIKITPITRITKSVTICDVTDEANPDTLVKRDKAIQTNDDLPVTAGFHLKINNVATLQVDTLRSAWSKPDSVQMYQMTVYSYSQTKGVPEPSDYMIEFGEVGLDSATSFFQGTREIPGGPVNFTVYRLYPSDTGEVKIRSKFGLIKRDAKARASEFCAFTNVANKLSDQIVFLNDDEVPGYVFSLLASRYDAAKRSPVTGDYITIRQDAPFLSNDMAEFVVKGQQIDEKLANQNLDRIQVVPNPYVVSNSWEPPNLFTTGRGPRTIHFTHLPMKCTIKIFSVRGQLVTTLEHDSQSVADGMEPWDLRTKDQLDIAFGVYVYHVDAGKLGTKVGKFAVIK